MLPSANIARDLDGAHTEVLLQAFADRILVLVTQIGKVGTLIQASIPATTALDPAPPPDPSEPNVIPLPPPPPAIQLTPLLGSAPSDHMHTLHSLYVSQIATVIWTEEVQEFMEAERRPIVVGLALRKTAEAEEDLGLTVHEKKVFYGIMEMVRELVQRN
ncbi:uncharacterized protein C8Q71DRAFT_233573 [Rhodofomes roseus]|uniref:Proteasome assembly chaperone 3 n=1 Tax=Rhodofomes roseus TaxID=34475 RepID=A0ABQ8KVH9_9APHY|nr:uncharacterized protein C8Q71DRAFT_233573 [Rhodofomes roseus]KAH9843060.1 hypothetical protein C8Q71DRAFT_233573 [Rhodofomes roseus]